MGWVIFFSIVGGIILLAYFNTQRFKKEDEREGNIVKERGSFKTKYIGGFSDLAGEKFIDIAIKEDSIVIEFKHREHIPNRIIPMNLIKNIEIKTESQISRDVTLGRMLVFGVFALGMKKESTVVTNYLVITVDNNGEDRSIIFYSTMPEQIVQAVRKIKNIESIF